MPLLFDRAFGDRDVIDQMIASQYKGGSDDLVVTLRALYEHHRAAADAAPTDAGAQLAVKALRLAILDDQRTQPRMQRAGHDPLP